MTALVDADRLYRFFHVGDDETMALQGVSMVVNPGEMVAVTGPSGSGKSTLLACLAGIDEPDGGVVTIAGERMTRRLEPERAALRARSIGVLLQHGNLLPALSLIDNVTIAQRLAARADKPAVLTLLANLGLAQRATARPSQLSGGETARAGLAVALANSPSVVLADEPTGELDTALSVHVLDVLRAHAATGGAVVVVTHSPAVAQACDREIRLVDGKVA